MSHFGGTLFGSSPFIRWALSPFILLFVILMPLCVEKWTSTALLITAGMEALCLALLAGFWLPARIGHWAFRLVAALVFLAYTSYLVHEFFFTDAPLRFSGPRSQASPRNALLGYFIIGLPCFWYALKGRFTLGPQPSGAQLAAERKADEDQLLNPDWAFYQRHLQRPVPAAVRELYADRTLLTADVLEYPGPESISTFNPINEKGLLDTQEFIGSDVLAFATSESGDPIYLRPGASEPDTVYITYHDGGDTEIFAESVAMMLEKLKKANPVLRQSGESN